MPRRIPLSIVLLAALAAPAAAQTPQPFPRPGEPTRPQPAPRTPQQPPADAKVLPPVDRMPAAVQPAADEPTEATLGIPVYPGAQYLTSYDAGSGQRYYLFGTNIEFASIVTYYRSTLRNRGDLVFELPPIHMFEVGRFREQTMAFPPSVTVKDYTWGGSPGYINPRPGAEPSHFRTIIQIVPPPPGTAR